MIIPQNKWRRYRTEYGVAHSDEEVEVIVRKNAVAILVLMKTVLEDQKFSPSLPTAHEKYDKRAMARKHHSRGGQQK